MNNDERRVCLLTGASGRLGTFFCRRLVHRYAIVAVTRSRPLPVPTQHQRFVDPLEPDSQLPANANHVFEVQADLTDDSALRRVAEIAMARFGGVDLLVNAARITPRMSLLAFTPEELQEQFLLNTTVPMRLAAALAEQCWLGHAEENRRRNRNIVNVSSTYGTYLGPFSGNISGYGASKAALNLLSIELASRLRASGIRVNVLGATSFPTSVPTEAVARQVVALDQGNVSGRIVVVRPNGLDVVRPGWQLGLRPGTARTAAQQQHADEELASPRTDQTTAGADEGAAETDADARSRVELAAAQPVLRRAGAPPRPRTRGPRPPLPQPLTGLPAPIADLRRRYHAQGYVRLPGVLESERLLPLLAREARQRQHESVVSQWDRYGLGLDSSYFSGPMQFRSSNPGTWLTWLHRHSSLQRLARGLTGNPGLVPEDSLSYMYYSAGSFIHVHTDVPECEITLLASVVGQVPPLVVYPRFRARSPRELMRLANASSGIPAGGRRVPIPIDGFLAIDGRALPHRRPEVVTDGTVVLATLCYRTPRPDTAEAAATTD
jgi:NAD(P)-dependent dehydrogenase (short-subunit alcohol dehydrogenase family)